MASPVLKSFDAYGVKDFSLTWGNVAVLTTELQVRILARYSLALTKILPKYSESATIVEKGSIASLQYDN